MPSSKRPSKQMMKLMKRRCPVVTPNTKRIQAYQVVEGFTRCPVASDGNCFYTATGFFCGVEAAEMRRIVMSYFIYKKAEYSIFFESEADFLEAVKVNRMSRVWNSELCDIASHAMAQILKRDVVIHNYIDGVITEILTPYSACEQEKEDPIYLFRSFSHYEILIPNNKLPNKNICPLPDISAFYESINLTNEDNEPVCNFDEDISEDFDKCFIKFI